MDVIYECAAKFIALENYEYKFVVSQNRKSRDTTRNSKNLSSYINADYIIESQFKRTDNVVYIFLKARKENPNVLCVVSFFKKDTITYGGDILYWMLKEKRNSCGCVTLFRHKNYKQS